MSVITNIVVALMIVTQGEEPVKAIPYTEPPKISDGGIMFCNDLQSYLNKYAWGDPETLYRKTCKTNFVYSTTIQTGRIGTVKCRHRPCGLFHAYQPCDLFGRDIEYIGFRVDDWYCPAHQILGGAK